MYTKVYSFIIFRFFLTFLFSYWFTFFRMADTKEVFFQLIIITSVPIINVVILHNVTSEKLVTTDVLEIRTDALSRVEW